MLGKGARIHLVALVAGGLLALPVGAAAQSTQDASCPPAGGSNFVFNGNSRVAQTFTAGLTGKLTSAQIRVTKNMADGPGPYSLSIASVDGTGTPTNTTLGATTIAEPPGGSLNLPVTGFFTTSPPAVTAGQLYALVVSRPGSGNLGLRVETRNFGCAGSMFNSTSQTGPYADSMVDLIFTTFVDRPPSVSLGRHPKGKSRKRKASFEFSSDEVGAAFQCSLDGGPFSPCTSPKTYQKLKRRRHTFAVKSVDAVQNVSDTTPSFSWKILKQKK